MEFYRKYNGPKVTFKFDGPAYKALSYAKMKSGMTNPRFTSKQLKACLAGAFNSVDGATKALKVLEKNDCVYRVDGLVWEVTETGKEVIRHVGISRKAPLYTHGMG